MGQSAPSLLFLAVAAAVVVVVVVVVAPCYDLIHLPMALAFSSPTIHDGRPLQHHSSGTSQQLTSLSLSSLPKCRFSNTRLWAHAKQEEYEYGDDDDEEEEDGCLFRCRATSSEDYDDEDDDDVVVVDDNDDDQEEWDEKGQEIDNHGVGVNGEISLGTLSHQIAQTQQQLQIQQQQINQMLNLLLPSEMPFAYQSPSSSRIATPGFSTPLSSSTAATTTASPRHHTTTNPSTATPVSSSSSSSAVVPLRVMVFIDGTWVYYSLFQRDVRCTIANKYGFGWHTQYRFNWEALPGVICRALQQDDTWSSSSSSMQSRPIEISRMSVYTSYKATTPEESHRYQLFQDMRAAGYDVFSLETVGKSEKCVDIQLAVEMLHYATVPNAYDVAVLLSGDKDFMPALIRVRQKGRKVAIVSMKSGVNRALSETDGLKDYDIMWLEDHFDELIVPLDEAEREHRGTALNDEQEEGPRVHAYVMIRLAWEFVNRSKLSYVSTRDVGRYFKSAHIDASQRNFLNEIKDYHLGLQSFLKRSGVFSFRNIPNENSKLLTLLDESKLEHLRSHVHLSEKDEKLLNKHLALMPTDKADTYYFSRQYSSKAPTRRTSPRIMEPNTPVTHATTLPDDLTTDYTMYTVTKLKERCRERGLSVTGLKADLLERILKDVQEQLANLEHNSQRHEEEDEDWSTKYLLDLVQEYLHARGGFASSRDVGRYLAANKRKIPGFGDKTISANAELKAKFGSLNHFFFKHSDLFEIDEDFVDGNDPTAKYAFRVSLKKS